MLCDFWNVIIAESRIRNPRPGPVSPSRLSDIVEFYLNKSKHLTNANCMTVSANAPRRNGKPNKVETMPPANIIFTGRRRRIAVAWLRPRNLCVGRRGNKKLSVWLNAERGICSRFELSEEEESDGKEKWFRCGVHAIMHFQWQIIRANICASRTGESERIKLVWIWMNFNNLSQALHYHFTWWGLRRTERLEETFPLLSKHRLLLKQSQK